jgi:hypothetical protein
MDHEEQTGALLAPSAEFLATVSVFPLIPAIKRDVSKTIDSALTWECVTAACSVPVGPLTPRSQLTASDINFSIVRPIVLKYAKLKNMAVVYACLVVRVPQVYTTCSISRLFCARQAYFLEESEDDLAYAGVMLSRVSWRTRANESTEHNSRPRYAKYLL